MDTDLFQILTLILLLGLLLTLFGVLQSLGAIRKSLEQGSPAQTTSPAPEAAAASRVTEPDEQPSTWARPEDTAQTGAPEPESARTGWPAPQEAAATPEPSTTAAEPAAAAPAADTGGARVLYGDAGLTTATPSETSLRPAESAEPAASTAAAAASADTGGSTLGGAAAESQTAAAESQRDEDPQEQPFERDGRWWFRRGDELLVYEEQTGQWVAAPEPSTTASVAASAPPSGDTVESASAATPEGQVTIQQEAVGSFWKCPSCGAVNGSTATSCRMCFTARP